MESFDDRCFATFKNKKLSKFLENFMVIEIEKEEWVIVSDDGDTVALRYKDNEKPNYFISKSLIEQENLGPNNTYVEIHKHPFIDLAKLLGFRNTCLGQKGDKCLTKKEATQLVKAFNGGECKTIIPLGRGKITKERNRWIRLLQAYISCDEKGETTISFGSHCSGETWAALIAISKAFPKTRIVLQEYHEYYCSREEYSMSHVIYVFKNGYYKIVKQKHKYENYLDEDD